MSDDDHPDKPRRRYRPWSELLERTFAVGVLACSKCSGRMARWLVD